MLAVSLGFSPLAAQDGTNPTPVFGFVRLTLAGSGSGAGNNFVGPALVEQEEYRGQLDAGVPAARTLTDSRANWTASAFDTHPTANSHYVEIIASPNAAAVGLVTDIVSHTATTLTTADDISSLLQGGETIVIRRHRTLAGLFGSANEAGLGQGDSSSADTISILTAGPSAAFTSFYFRSGASLGGTGWRSSSNPFVDQSQTPVRTGEGLLIKRKQAQPLNLVLGGYVKTGPLRRVLESGYNLVDPLAVVTDQSAAPLPGARFTLGGTASDTIIPSGLGEALSQGSTQTADLVSVFSAASGFTSYYIAVGSQLGAGGWRTTSNPFADMQGTVIPPATALLIQNRGSVKSWTRPQPFVFPAP